MALGVVDHKRIRQIKPDFAVIAFSIVVGRFYGLWVDIHTNNFTGPQFGRGDGQTARAFDVGQDQGDFIATVGGLTGVDQGGAARRTVRLDGETVPPGSEV